MRRLLSMAGKDLLRRWRSPLAVAIMLAFPLLFSLVMAVTFGSGSGGGLPAVKILVEDRDESLLGMLLLGAFSSEEMSEYFQAEEVGEEGLALMEEGEASALLRIPEKATEHLVKGEPVVFELLRNPAQGILPEAAEQAATVLVEVLDVASRVLRGPLDELAPLFDTDEGPSDASVATISVAMNQVMTGAQGYLFPPAITLETVTVTPEGEGDDEDPEGGGGLISLIFLMILPGISVYSLFILGDMGMRDLLEEQTQGTLRRQLAGPVSPALLVGAKALHTSALSAICLLILAAVAWIVAGRGVSPPGFLILSAGLVMAVTGAASVVYGMARSQRQGSTVASLVYLGLGMASGSFIPLDNLPAFLRNLAPYSPFYWATEGYRALLAEEAGAAEILTKALALAAVGAVLLALGSGLLGRRVRQGAA